MAALYANIIEPQAKYPGVAQLVACLNGVQEAGRSNRPTRTKKSGQIFEICPLFITFQGKNIVLKLAVAEYGRNDEINKGK